MRNNSQKIRKIGDKRETDSNVAQNKDAELTELCGMNNSGKNLS